MNDLVFFTIVLLDFLLIFFLVSKQAKSLVMSFIASFSFYIFKVYLLVFAFGFFSLLTRRNLTVAWGLSVLVEIYLFFRFYNLDSFKQLLKLQLNSYGSFFNEVINKNWYMRLASLIFLLLLIYILFVVFLQQPTDIDGLTYHLGFVGFAQQLHTIRGFVSDYVWINAYPKSMEMLQLFYAVVNPTGNFIEGLQIPFLLVTVAAFYKLARTFKVDRQYAYLTSLSLLATPLIANQLRTSYIDVALAGLILIALVLIFELKNHPKLVLSVAPIILAFIMGAKASGFLLAGFLVLLACVINFSILKTFILDLRKPASKKLLLKILAYLAVAIVIMFMVGGYWYWEVYHRYGNPLYPFQITLLGHTLPGYLDLSVFNTSYPAVITSKNFFEKVIFYASEQNAWFGCMYNYDSNFAGFGPNWPILFAPAILFAGFFVSKIKRKDFLITTAFLLVLWYFYTAGWYGRYTIFMLYWGMLSFAIMLPKLNKYVRGILILIFIFNFVYIVPLEMPLCVVSPQTIYATLQDENYYYYHPYQNYYDFAYAQDGQNVAVSSVGLVFRYELWGHSWSNKVFEFEPQNAADVTNFLNDHQIDLYYTDKNMTPFLGGISGYKLIYDDGTVEVYQK